MNSIFTQPIAAQKCCFKDNALSHEKGQSIMSIACPNVATLAGYCAEHRYAGALLELARQYGCPELLPPMNKKTKEREGLIIRRGIASWEAYCMVASKENAVRIGARLEEQCRALFKKGAA